MISSKENPQIKAAKRLLQRKGRDEDRALLIEGARLVEDAWRAGIEPYLVFVQPEMLTSTSPAHALLDELVAAGVTIEETSKSVFAELSETVTPQGIAAVLPIPEIVWPETLTLVLALDGVRDPGNAGTMMRSAEAVGAQGVIYGPNTVDPYNGKVIRAAMGTHFRLPLRELDSWDAAHVPIPMERWFVATGGGAIAYDGVDWREPAALFIGSEATGAGEVIRQLATPIAIPMLGGVESLNAAMAGTVVLFEIARQRRGKSA